MNRRRDPPAVHAMYCSKASAVDMPGPRRGAVEGTRDKVKHLRHVAGTQETHPVHTRTKNPSNVTAAQYFSAAHAICPCATTCR